MAIREDLITEITAKLSGHSSYNISSELPYDSNETPLYQKNLRTVYVDEQQDDVTEFIPTLDSQDILQTLTTVNVYLTTDAKNQTSDINTVISNIMLAADGISGKVQNDRLVTTEITADTITYTFEYNFITI